jgi:hypothetical protein
MVSNLDIWRAANLLIRKHGADAALEAARLKATSSESALLKRKPRSAKVNNLFGFVPPSP